MALHQARPINIRFTAHSYIGHIALRECRCFQTLYHLDCAHCCAGDQYVPGVRS